MTLTVDDLSELERRNNDKHQTGSMQPRISKADVIILLDEARALCHFEAQRRGLMGAIARLGPPTEQTREFHELMKMFFRETAR